EIHDKVRPTPQDFVLTRHLSFDGSYGTELYPLLRRLGRSVLMMAGISTNFAVEAIVRASVNRGFRMVVIEDGCASVSEEMHRWSIANIMPVFATVTTADEVLAYLVPR